MSIHVLAFHLQSYINVVLVHMFVFINLAMFKCISFVHIMSTSDTSTLSLNKCFIVVLIIAEKYFTINFRYKMSIYILTCLILYCYQIIEIR